MSDCSEKVPGGVGPGQPLEQSPSPPHTLASPTPHPGHDSKDRYLELVEVVAVFPILYHSTKHQQASPVAHEAIGCTPGGYVPSHGWDEPLVGC